jgi:hypothetical protein
VLICVFFSSTKKLHEDTKDKEPVLDVKEEKPGVEGVYASAPSFVQQICVFGDLSNRLLDHGFLYMEITNIVQIVRFLENF